MEINLASGIVLTVERLLSVVVNFNVEHDAARNQLHLPQNHLYFGASPAKGERLVHAVFGRLNVHWSGLFEIPLGGYRRVEAPGTWPYLALQAQSPGSPVFYPEPRGCGWRPASGGRLRRLHAANFGQEAAFARLAFPEAPTDEPADLEQVAWRYLVCLLLRR